MIPYETPRTITRELKVADTEYFVELMTSPAIIKYFFDTDIVRSDAEKSINNIISKYDTNKRLNIFAVARKESVDDVIGLISYTPVNDKDVEMFGALMPDYWGKKFSNEIGAGMIKYLFGSTNFTRILAYVRQDNKSSRAAMLRIGFQFEGLVQHPQYTDEVCLFTLVKEKYTAAIMQ